MKFDFAEIEEMAKELLAKGWSPARVRRKLAEYGVRWEYQFVGQGARERSKRLIKMGRVLCPCGKDSFVPPEDMCRACLVKKWGIQ